MYRRLFEQSPTAMVVYDTSLRVVDCNDAMAAVLGTTRDRVIGLRADDRRDQHQGAALQRALAGTGVHYEGVYHPAAGLTFMGSAVFAPLRDPRDELTGVMVLASGCAEEVSKCRDLEEQLVHAQRMEPLALLAGGVAHDFNNLLTIVQVSSDFLERELGDAAPLRRYVRDIQWAAIHAARLTRQLLAFSRRQNLHRRPIDLNELVSETSSMLRRLIGEDIELVTTLDHELCPIIADPGQVHQVLMNLAINARDAMPDGGVLHLLTSTTSVEGDDSSLTAARYAVLTVADTGHGIDGGIQPRIFEPFFTTKTSGDGTGLGLPTVLGIVEQSGGTITVASEPGRGTRFTIRLPCAMADVGLGEAAPPHIPHTHPTHQSTVLVVEDEPAVRAISARVLEQHGFIVLTAEDGNEALLMADRIGGSIDILVTDLVLPGFDGRRLAERLRRRRPEVRVVYMTGYTHDEMHRRGLADERLTLLEKPFTAAQLASAVQQALRA